MLFRSIVKIMNKSQAPRSYQLTVEGHPELSLQVTKADLTVQPSSLLQIPVNVQLDPQYMDSSNMPIEFVVTAVDDDSISAHAESRFMGPTLR